MNLRLFEFELFALFLSLGFEDFVVVDVGLLLLLQFERLLLEENELFLEGVRLLGW